MASGLSCLRFGTQIDDLDATIVLATVLGRSDVNVADLLLMLAGWGACP